MRKQMTKVLEKPANEGKHSQKAWRKIRSLLIDHGFLQPRLYHLVLMDDIEWPDAGRFQRSLKALCRKLNLEGIDYHWRACLERDDEKGLHFHIFILVEAKYFNPCSVINTTKTGWLTKMLATHRMTFNLAPPKAAIHLTRDGKRLNYATLAGAKLDDCLERISYLVKARSKPTDIRSIYFSSRTRRSTAVPSIIGVVA